MNRKLPQGRPLSGLYIVIFCPYSAQIPLTGEGQLKLLVSKPSGLQVDKNIGKFISAAFWNKNSLSFSLWEAEMDPKSRGKGFLCGIVVPSTGQKKGGNSLW